MLKDDIQTHNLDPSTIPHISISQEDKISIYRTMNEIRYMEIRVADLYKQKKIRGFCHLCIGQEAIYAALKYVMEGDMVVKSYRCHGLALVTGCSVREVVGEMLGKRTGCSKGKGGSMHLYNSRFFGGHGIVGAQVPLSLGVAFALQRRRENCSEKSKMSGVSEKSENQSKEINNHTESQNNTGIQNNAEPQNSSKVCFTFYGDGAANQGQIWESFNMAAIWKLPIVFVCEKNKYGMYTPAEAVSDTTEFFRRGVVMPGICVEDTDLESLVSVLKYSREYAAEHGPIIVQIQTNRLCSHSTVDEVDDRSFCEIEQRKILDCMNKLREALGDTKAIEDEVACMVDLEIEEAENDEYNSLSKIFTDITL